MVVAPTKRTQIPAIVLVLAMVLVAGGASALYWFGSIPLDVPYSSDSLLAALALCALGLVGHLALRWLRWHFLLRGGRRDVPTRHSARVFFGTSITLFTPFNLGELVRAWPLRRYGVSVGRIARVWLAERLYDLSAVLPMALLAHGAREAVVALALLWAAAAVAERHLLEGRRPSLFYMLVAPALTWLLWSLPVFSLLAVVHGFQCSLSLQEAATAFGWSNLWGGATGTQVSSLVSGSSMILRLQAADVPLQSAVWSTAVFRMGTVWLGLAIAVWAGLKWGRSLGSSTATQQQFDEIAAFYESLIPDHVRERLLERKTRVMCDALERAGISPGARGLDVGCGQAGYLQAMANCGYTMAGVDASQGQVAEAVERLRGSALDVDIRHASADSLPFEDGSFDFVYLINVAHHITDPERSRAAFAEMLRVLRPGGVLFLHEINTLNPLFRFYMGYVFPLLRPIDDGTEQWLSPHALPDVPGARWLEEVSYFTFLPDTIPAWLLRVCAGLERRLERSRFKAYSAHYMATLEASHR